MSDAFTQFFELLERSTGIALDLSKLYLIESRLGPLARQQGHAEVAPFVNFLNRTPVGALHHKAFDALTTNETTFFRDPHVYDALRQIILPDLIKKKSAERALRIWSAACSTGQEPYSLSILLHELIPNIESWNIYLSATDYSDRALTKAKEGLYSVYETSRGLNALQLARYFTDTGKGYQVNRNIRSLVRFSPINLIEAWPPRPLFDLVLVRNVLIYFSQATKDRILAKIQQGLHPADGILLLGSTEMIPIGDRFRITQLDKISYYRPLPR